ncbi:MAG: glycosyltransferase family 2 protein [Cohnella sp.]|uniref:glycosyltransferase family 2 protein n=1 Tax=Cohnella sp. TaxID=1883426 RepID=UPI000E3A6C1F|nr:glycosyltransferase family 2 protein [Cohnella sp.]REK66489.1 MAG: glycosyltransferase family 2 protein [Cohnella sp.]
MIKDEVSILLSTYNGSKYLKELLESLINQTYKEWICYIRDDGSTDNTREILNSYVNRYPGRFIIADNSNQNLKPCQSFFKLLRTVKRGKYFMFCDQDDIWDHKKIEITIAEMKNIESRIGEKKPILVHSDLEVVDENLNRISYSMKRMQKIDCSRKNIRSLILQNNITGCTVMINRELLRIVSRTPENAIMHDWWFALVASCFGEISFINKPLIKYRQHSKNSVGAKKRSIFHLLKRINFFKMSTLSATYRNYLIKIIKQSEEFFTIYEQDLKGKEKEIIYYFKEIKSKGLIRKIYYLLKYKINAQNWRTSILLKLIIIFIL